MTTLLGIFFHFLGGFAAGSFYIPFRNVKKWAEETAWITGGIASWILARWLFGLLSMPALWQSRHDERKRTGS